MLTMNAVVYKIETGCAFMLENETSMTHVEVSHGN